MKFGNPSFYANFLGRHYGTRSMVNFGTYYGRVYCKRKPLKHMHVHKNAVIGPKKIKPWKQTLTWRFNCWDTLYSFYGQFDEHLYGRDVEDVTVYQLRMYSRKSAKTSTKAWGWLALKNLGYGVKDRSRFGAKVPDQA